MSSNPNWHRWIFASVSKHFNDLLNTTAHPLYIEGQKRSQNAAKDFFELRMDGPRIQQTTRDIWFLDVDVGMILQSTMDETSYHRIHQNCGLVVSAFTTIQLYKYGDNVGDDQSLFGCLNLARDSDIKTYHFGVLKPDIGLLQASVEAHYTTRLTT